MKVSVFSLILLILTNILHQIKTIISEQWSLVTTWAYFVTISLFLFEFILQYLRKKIIQRIRFWSNFYYFAISPTFISLISNSIVQIGLSKDSAPWEIIWSGGIETFWAQKIRQENLSWFTKILNYVKFSCIIFCARLF